MVQAFNGTISGYYMLLLPYFSMKPRLTSSRLAAVDYQTFLHVSAFALELGFEDWQGLARVRGCRKLP